MNTKNPPGMVYLIGAGPGDPGLTTVRAMQLLASADVVVYDALANPALLREARDDAELIDVGKRAGDHKMPQEQINQLLADLALDGKNVARLKGGDPYVFGRGSEEALHLHACGVKFEIVPGITSGIAGPAYAGIPVTHRQVATSCTFITGHEDPTKDETQTNYQALAGLAKTGGTLCFYMGIGRLPVIVEQLTRHGLPLDTPAAVVQWGTRPYQRSIRSTLENVAADVKASGLGAPAIILVGHVAGLDNDALNWFERRPLFGKTILVTRTRHQASDLRLGLEELGAAVIEAATIDIAPPGSWQPILDALREVRSYDWLILTSPNGVRSMGEAMAKLGVDARALAGVKIAVVGRATDNALRQLGLVADLVPQRGISDELAADLLGQEDMAGRKVLMLRADIARPALNERLIAAGAEVTDLPIYQTLMAESLDDQVVEALEAGRIDWVTFTSSSTARNLVALLGGKRHLLDGVRCASIGEITSATVRELGLPVTCEAAQSSIPSLIDAIVADEAAE